MKFGLNNLPFLGCDNFRNYAQPWPTGMCAGLYVVRRHREPDNAPKDSDTSNPLPHFNGVEIWPNAGPRNPTRQDSTIGHCIKADMNNICQGKCANHVPCSLEEHQFAADINGPYHPTTPSGMSKLPRDPARDCTAIDVNGRCFGPIGGPVGGCPPSVDCPGTHPNSTDQLNMFKCPDHWMYMFQNPEDMCFNIKTFKTYEEEKYALGIGSPIDLPNNMPVGEIFPSCNRYYKFTDFMDWPTSTHCWFKKYYLIFANKSWDGARDAQDGWGAFTAYSKCFGCPPWKTDQELINQGLGYQCFTPQWGGGGAAATRRINWTNQNFYHNCDSFFDLDHLYKAVYRRLPGGGIDQTREGWEGCVGCSPGTAPPRWSFSRGCWPDRMALWWNVLCQAYWQAAHAVFMAGFPTYQMKFLCAGYDPCVTACDGDDGRKRRNFGGINATGGIKNLYSVLRAQMMMPVENCWEDSAPTDQYPGFLWFPATGVLYDSAGCPQDVSDADNYRVRYEWTEFVLDPLRVNGPVNNQVPIQPLTIELCQNIALGQHTKWLVHDDAAAGGRHETRTFLLHSGSLDPKWIETGLLLPSLNPHNANAVKIPDYNRNFVREYEGVRTELGGGHLAAKEELWRDFNTLNDKCGVTNNWQPENCAYFEDPEGIHEGGMDTTSCVGNWPAWSKVCVDYYKGERYLAQTNWICTYDTFNIFTAMIRRQPAFIGTNAANQIGLYSAGYDRDNPWNEKHRLEAEGLSKIDPTKITEPWQRGYPFILNDNSLGGLAGASPSMRETGFLCGLHFEWGDGVYELGYTQGMTFWDKTGFQGLDDNENCIIEPKYCNCGPEWRTSHNEALNFTAWDTQNKSSNTLTESHGAWAEGHVESTGDFKVIKELTVYGPSPQRETVIGTNHGIDGGQMIGIIRNKFPKLPEAFPSQPQFVETPDALPPGIIEFGLRQPNVPNQDGFSWSLTFTSHRLTDGHGCLSDEGLGIYQIFRNISEHSGPQLGDSQYYKQGIFNKYIYAGPMEDSRISDAKTTSDCAHKVPGAATGDGQALIFDGARSHIYAWIPRIAYSTGKIGGLWWHHMKKIGAPGDDLDPNSNGSGSWYNCSGLGTKAVQLFGAGKVGVIDFLNYKCGYGGDLVGPKFNWTRSDFVRPDMNQYGNFINNVNGSGWSNFEWAHADEASLTGITDVVVRYLEKRVTDWDTAYSDSNLHIRQTSERAGESRSGGSTPFSQDVCYDVSIAIPASVKFNLDWDRKEINENGFRGAGFIALFASGIGLLPEYQMGDYSENFTHNGVEYLGNTGFNPVGAYYHINVWNIWDHKPSDDLQDWWKDVPGWYGVAPSHAQQNEYGDLFYSYPWFHWKNYDSRVSANHANNQHGNAPIHITAGHTNAGWSNLYQSTYSIDDYNYYHVDEIFIPLSGRTADRSRQLYADEFGRSYIDHRHIDYFGLKHMCGHRFINACGVEKNYYNKNHSHVWKLDPTCGWRKDLGVSGYTNPILFAHAYDEWKYGAWTHNDMWDMPAAASPDVAQPQAGLVNIPSNATNHRWISSTSYSIYVSGSGLFEFPYGKERYPGKVEVLPPAYSLRTQLVSGVEIRAGSYISMALPNDNIANFECPKNKFDEDFVRKTQLASYNILKNDIIKINDKEHGFLPQHSIPLPHCVADFRPIPFRYTIHLIRDSEAELWDMGEVDPPYFSIFDDGTYQDLLKNVAPHSFDRLFVPGAHYSPSMDHGYDIDLAGSICAIDFHGALQEPRHNGLKLNLECSNTPLYDMTSDFVKYFPAWHRYPARTDKIVMGNVHTFDQIQGGKHLDYLVFAGEGDPPIEIPFSTTPNLLYQATCTTGHMTELGGSGNPDLFYHRSGINLSMGGNIDGIIPQSGTAGQVTYAHIDGKKPILLQKESAVNHWDDSWTDLNEFGRSAASTGFLSLAERAEPLAWPPNSTPWDSRQPIAFAVSHPNRGFFGMKINDNNCPDPVEVSWTAPVEECCWWTDIDTYTTHKITPQYVGYKNYREKITVDVKATNAPDGISGALHHQFVMFNSKWKEHCSYGRDENDFDSGFCGPEVPSGTGFWHNTEIHEVYVPIRIFKNYADYDAWKPTASMSTQYDTAYDWERAYPHQMMFDYNPCEQWYPPIFKWTQTSMRNVAAPSGSDRLGYPEEFDCNVNCCQFHNGLVGWNGTTTQVMWDAWPQTYVGVPLSAYPFDKFFGAVRSYEDPFSVLWGNWNTSSAAVQNCPHADERANWCMPAEIKRWDPAAGVKVGRYTLDLLTGITYEIEVNKVIEGWHPSGWRTAYFEQGCIEGTNYNDKCRIHFDNGYIHMNSPCDGCKDHCACGPHSITDVAGYPKKYAFIVGSVAGTDPTSGQAAAVALDKITFDVRGKLYSKRDVKINGASVSDRPGGYVGTTSSHPGSGYSTPAGATWINLPYWNRGNILIGDGGEGIAPGSSHFRYEYGSKCMPNTDLLVNDGGERHVRNFVTLDMGILGIGPPI